MATIWQILDPYRQVWWSA